MSQKYSVAICFIEFFVTVGLKKTHRNSSYQHKVCRRALQRLSGNIHVFSLHITLLNVESEINCTKMTFSSITAVVSQPATRGKYSHTHLQYPPLSVTPPEWIPCSSRIAM